MPKAKSHPDQFAFTFEAPKVASAPAALAGLERQLSGAVGMILNSDTRSREVLAAEMSVLLDEDITRAMLDAYASPAREGHRVIMSRFLALVAVCGRHDVLDQVLRPIGASLLVGDEVLTARLGHIERQMEELRAEAERLRGTAPLIRGNGH